MYCSDILELLSMLNIRNLRCIPVPLVQISRNSACMFFKIVKAQKDLNFVESAVPACSEPLGENTLWSVILDYALLVLYNRLKVFITIYILQYISLS